MLQLSMQLSKKVSTNVLFLPLWSLKSLNGIYKISYKNSYKHFIIKA